VKGGIDGGFGVKVGEVKGNRTLDLKVQQLFTEQIRIRLPLTSF